MRRQHARVGVVIAAAALAAVPTLGRAGGGDAWVIEPTAEEQGAAAAGAPELARAQELARAKQYVDAVHVLEALDRAHPASLHDCNLSLAYLRAGVLTRAQLLWDVAQLRNGDRPTWCTGDLSKQLTTALRAAGFVPVSIDVAPAGAVVEVAGIDVRGVHVVWLAPGPYTFVARAAGMADASQAITVASPSARVAITLAPPKVETPPPGAGSGSGTGGGPDLDAIHPTEPIVPATAPAPVRWPAWVAIGGGAAAVGVGAIFHAKALSARDDGDHAYVGSPALADAQSRFASARTGAIVSYAIGAAAIGFGGWWWHAHRAHGPEVNAAVGAHGGEVTLTWTWGGP
jgi:hypothetical protein